MEKFEFNFDAIEIEAHNIIQQDNGQITYEPADFGPSIPPDVWSVFGHAPIVDDGYPGHGGGRKLIADCESAEAAEALAGLVRDYIRTTYWNVQMCLGKPSPIELPPVQVHWITDRPKS